MEREQNLAFEKEKAIDGQNYAVYQPVSGNADFQSEEIQLSKMAP
jgi:hypothetical protein